MKLVILHLFAAVAFFHKNTGSWLTLEEGQGSKAVNCTEVFGNVCSTDPEDCDSIFLCVSGMEPIESTCPAGRTCNAGNCSLDQSLLCEYRKRTFKCQTEGMYPEPSDCKKYNYCIPPGNAAAIQGECENGWAYNPRTTFCDKRLQNGTCLVTDRAVPTCLSAGQNAPLPLNPVLYYICLPYSSEDSTLYPYIYKCPRNLRYMGNFVCN